ncbi:putative lyase [Limihaloglobus sulfuriphilus]|uniref:Putative lyase n=1 Tax=Limihaloglobus sulfuriphilus TaxID=1851148 RepID=A0A1Q2MFT3_9BACT|nr:HEAT repeat domain-containing protein [Limihaloglobus sulfuriphilus]AQQ71563.1 putative lyase [Limihaloglobus sulfuriphilus]
MKKIKLITLISCVFAALCFGMGGSSPSNIDLLGGSDQKDKAVEIIRQGLKSQDSTLRTNAVEAVVRSGYMPLMDDVVKMLSDESVPVRFAALVAIGDLSYMPAEPYLIKYLKDSDQNVQMAAAYALSSLGHQRYQPRIAEGVNSTNQTVKANSVMLLGKIDNPDAKKILEWILKSPDAADKVKIQAIESLAHLGDTDMYHKAWALLISKRSDDRIIGVRIMTQLKTAKAVNAVKTMLRDDLVEIRIAAAAALARLNDPAGGILLKEYFDSISGGIDKESRKRCNVQAALGLMELDQQKFGKYTRVLLNDKDEMIRIYGAMVVLNHVR